MGTVRCTARIISRLNEQAVGCHWSCSVDFNLQYNRCLAAAGVGVAPSKARVVCEMNRHIPHHRVLGQCTEHVFLLCGRLRGGSGGSRVIAGAAGIFAIRHLSCVCRSINFTRRLQVDGMPPVETSKAGERTQVLCQRHTHSS